MTIDEYKDLILEDEINIGYDVEEDDLPEELEEESYIAVSYTHLTLPTTPYV